jgi:hypothetical protein
VVTESLLDLAGVRQAAHALGQKRRDARRDYERYCEKAADAERDYRKRLAIAWASMRSEGLLSMGAIEVQANSDAADQKHTRDIAQSLAKSALLRIEELEADRAMLRQIGEWSKELETVG